MTELHRQSMRSTLWAALLLALFPILAAADSGPKPPKGRGEQCVKPVDEMRRDHMDLLKHQRDETMYLGIRPKAGGSLKGCLACHSQKDDQGLFIPINAPDQFCGACHEYAAVSIDCFQCHATKPEQE